MVPHAETPPISQRAVSASRLVWLLAAALLLALALAKFVYHDALRLAYPVNDLTNPWVASQAFLHRKDPYGDIQEFATIWAARGAPLSAQYQDYSRILADVPMVYPPTTLALIAPLGLFRWHAAVWIYVIGSMALFIFGIFLLAQNFPLPWRDPRKLYFVAFVLAIAPLHFGAEKANLITLAIACVCVGVALLPRRPTWSGIAIAIAVCLKPQVAIWFFAYMWLRKKWKTGIAALVVCVVISACSLMWMEIHHVEWFRSFLSEFSRFSASGGVSSADAPGALGFQMINLQILTFQFTGSLRWSGILARAVFLVLAGAAAFLIRSRVSDRNESVGIAIVAVLTLLPVYQRFHTAEILLFVVYWAVQNSRLKGARATLLLMLPLLFPFVPWLVVYAGVPLQLPSHHASLAAKVAVAVERFVRGHNLSQSILWNGFVLPHVIWIELILLLILLASLYRQSPIASCTSAPPLAATEPPQ